MKRILILLTLWLFCTLHAYAGEPEFFIQFSDCKIATGYLVLSDESLRVFDGDPTAMGCSRDSNKISCQYTFEGSQQAKAVAYNITMDSPPLLHFAASNGSEYIAIDTSQHAAVIITRIVQKQFIGSKVCQGMYATAFELEQLENK